MTVALEWRRLFPMYGCRLVALMDVSDVRELLKEIRDFDCTAMGGRYEDTVLARPLLQEQFTEKRAKVKDALSKEDFEVLERVFATRWNDVAHGSLDYTATQDGHNDVWIRLAKALCDTKHFSFGDNYYRLLFPTLKQSDVEPLTREPFLKIPLNKLIVSDDLKELISVETIILQVETNGLMMSISEAADPRPLTETEKKRIEKYKEALWEKLEDNVIVPDDTLRISKETVYAIKELVEGSASLQGEVGETKLGSVEEAFAELAYGRFACYLETITPEEKKALWGQFVKTTVCRASTFGEEYNKTVNTPKDKTEVRRCTTHVAAVFAKLVMQYIEGVKFNNEVLEGWKQTGNWSKGLVKKTFSAEVADKDYDKDDTFYRNRCLTLLIYIMSHRFEVSHFGGNTILFNDQENKSVPNSAAAIQKLILKATQTDNFKRAYHDLQQYVVKPALLNPSSSRYDDTQHWLVSLKNETFWKGAISDITHKELGAKLLCFLEANPVGRIGVRYSWQLREEILSLSLKDASDNLAAVELSIILCQLKNELTGHEIEKLDRILTGKGKSVKKMDGYFREQVIQCCIDNLAHKEKLGKFPFFEPIVKRDSEIHQSLIKVFSEIRSQFTSDQPIDLVIDALVKEARARGVYVARAGSDRSYGVLAKLNLDALTSNGLDKSCRLQSSLVEKIDDGMVQRVKQMNV